MINMNVKDTLQRQITHWVKTIRDFEDELNTIERNTPDFYHLARLQSEYKGRVYAARYIEDIFGFNFDTNFNCIN